MPDTTPPVNPLDVELDGDADDGIVVVHHGAIEHVQGWDPPRLLMRRADGSRYELAWETRDEDCVYVEPDAGLRCPCKAGWLVDHLLDLQNSRQAADPESGGSLLPPLVKADLPDPVFETQAAGQDLTHTTRTQPTTITTAHGRLTVDDWTTVSVSRSTDPQVTGSFIVMAHGLDYVGARPEALWVKLMPVVADDDPNHWAYEPGEQPKPSPRRAADALGGVGLAEAMENARQAGEMIRRFTPSALPDPRLPGPQPRGPSRPRDGLMTEDDIPFDPTTGWDAYTVARALWEADHRNRVGWDELLLGRREGLVHAADEVLARLVHAAVVPRHIVRELAAQPALLDPETGHCMVCAAARHSADWLENPHNHVTTCAWRQAKELMAWPNPTPRPSS
jgi:hypothetical protein